MVGPGHVDPAWANPLAVLGEGGRERAGSIEDLGEMARSVGGDVEDDEDGGGEILWEPSDKGLERFDATG